MSIYHVKSNTIADGTNTDLVRPSDWNSAHAYTLQDAVSITGNTAGTLANISSGTFYLAGGDNVTLSQDGNTVSVVAAVGGNNQTGGIYADSNSFGTSSGTYDFRSFSIEGSGGVSVAASDGGFVISGPQPVLSEFDPWGAQAPYCFMANATIATNSVHFAPFEVPQLVNAFRLNLFVFVNTGVNSSTTGSAGLTASVALYTQGTSDSTDRILLHWSNSAFLQFSRTNATQLVITNISGTGTTATSITATNASTYLINSVGGYRVMPILMSSTLTPGKYWFAIGNFTQATTATLGISYAYFSAFSIRDVYGPVGAVALNISTVRYPQVQIGLGSYATTTTAFPSSVALTTDNIKLPASNVTISKFYFNFSGYPAGTNCL